MRTFLAPYKFEIEDGTIEKLIKCINALEKTAYKETEEKIILKTDEFSSDSSNIWGFFNYGSYGFERSVIDTIKNIFTKKIAKTESALDKYFFFFYFNQDRKTGYLILQRIGNIGIRTILEDAIKTCKSLSNFKIQPIIIGYENLLKNPIKKITISVPQFPKEIESRIQNALDIENLPELKKDIVLIAKRNDKITTRFFEKFLQQAENTETSKNATILQEGESVRITVKSGKSDRTLYLHQGKVRSWFEIKPDVVINNQNDMKKECLNIIEQIIQEKVEKGN